MGWELEDDIKNRKATLDRNDECLYYFVSLSDVYFRLEEVKDDIEYAYSIFLLLDSVDEKTKLYKYFFKKVYGGIIENNLQEAFKLLFTNNKVFVAMWFLEEVINDSELINKQNFILPVYEVRDCICSIAKIGRKVSAKIRMPRYGR